MTGAADNHIKMYLIVYHSDQNLQGFGVSNHKLHDDRR